MWNNLHLEDLFDSFHPSVSELRHVNQSLRLAHKTVKSHKCTKRHDLDHLHAWEGRWGESVDKWRSR